MVAAAAGCYAHCACGCCVHSPWPLRAPTTGAGAGVAEQQERFRSYERSHGELDGHRREQAVLLESIATRLTASPLATTSHSTDGGEGGGEGDDGRGSSSRSSGDTEGDSRLPVMAAEEAAGGGEHQADAGGDGPAATQAAPTRRQIVFR